MKTPIHTRKKWIKKWILPFLCLLMAGQLIILSGCSSRPVQAIDGEKWKDDWIQIGTVLGVEAPEAFTLLENKDALSANGLYYAAWVTGSSVPYENIDGDTIDLYDAQFYLLLNETTSPEAAETNYQTLLASSEKNYDVHSKDTITCNGQAYTLITYDYTSETTPYAHGVSALGVCGANSICAELACVEGYEEDLTRLLTDFLDHCHYSTQALEE